MSKKLNEAGMQNEFDGSAFSLPHFTSAGTRLASARCA